MFLQKCLSSGSLIVLLTGCSPITVKTEFDPAAKFAGLHTYDWMPSKVDSAGTRDDADIERRIRSAVDDELRARGYSQASSDSSDFLVVFHAGIQKKMSVNSVDRYYGARPGGGWGYGPGSGWRPHSETYVSEYELGTLILDINSPESRTPIWRGNAHAAVSQSDSQETKDKRIREAVHRLLERFPPK